MGSVTPLPPAPACVNLILRPSMHSTLKPTQLNLLAAMSLMSAGMATMYLNERLSFGMAPDDIAGVFTQRLRWCVRMCRWFGGGGAVAACCRACAVFALHSFGVLVPWQPRFGNRSTALPAAVSSGGPAMAQGSSTLPYVRAAGPWEHCRY